MVTAAMPGFGFTIRTRHLTSSTSVEVIKEELLYDGMCLTEMDRVYVQMSDLTLGGGIDEDQRKSSVTQFGRVSLGKSVGRNVEHQTVGPFYFETVDY